MEETQNQIPQTPPQPVASPDPSVQATKGKKSKIILAVILFVVLVVIGVGGWWYYAMGKAYLLSSKAKFPWENGTNYKTSTEFSFSLNGLSKNDDFKKELSGYAEIQDNISISGTTNQQNVGDNFVGNGKYTLNYGDGFSVDLAGDYKLVDKMFYIKPDLSPLEMLGFGSAEDMGIADVWIQFDGEAFVEDKDAEKEKAYEERFDAFIDRVDDMGALSLKDPHKTKDSKFGKLMRIDYKLDGSQLDGIVLAAIDTGLSSAFDMAAKDLSNDDLEAMVSGDKDKFEKFKKENPEDWELMKYYVSNFRLSAWINTKTKNIQAFELSAENLKLNLEKDQGTMSFLINVFFEPADAIAIDKPENSMTFEDAMSAVMMHIMGGVMGPEPMVIDTDGDGLSDDLEYYYGTEVANPDTDGDGYTDGEEVMSGYNPLGEGMMVNNFGMGEYEDNQTICENTGGIWSNTNSASLGICSSVMIENFDSEFEAGMACEENEFCYWDFFSGSQCIGIENYCACPEGDYYLTDYDIFSGCN